MVVIAAAVISWSRVWPQVAKNIVHCRAVHTGSESLPVDDNSYLNRTGLSMDDIDWEPFDPVCDGSAMTISA